MAYTKDNIHDRYSDDEDELLDDEINLADNRDDDPGEINLSDGVKPTSDDSDFADLSADEDVSEPVEAETPPAKSRRRLFRLGHPTEPEGDDDFFDNDTDPEPAPKPKPKPQVLDPENPDYWIEDEPEIPSIIPKGRKKWIWWLAAALIPVVLLIGAWMWMFNPYVDGAVKYGYLKHMERRGTVVKTFEGEMFPYREVSENTPVFFEDFRFSVEADTTAAKMKRMMLGGVPVRLEYKVYHTSLPWRGEQKVVVTKADTADVSKILPPEFRIPGEVKK